MNKILTMVNLKRKNEKIIDINLYNKILGKVYSSKRIKINKPLNGHFTSHIASLNNLQNKLDMDVLSWCCNKYMNFYFDILGSGWKYMGTVKENGIESIDWSKDIITGKTVNDKKIFEEIDIKNIWELSRQYYLPQLALFKSLQSNEDFRQLVEERIFNDIFSIEELDAKHPCWTSPMDVAIRCCNQLVAIDICQKDKNSFFHEESRKSLLKSYFERSYKYILNNLELNFVSGKHGNHYISNIVGLIFIRSYYGIQEDPEVFDFLTKELLLEFDRQLLNDGTIYECSTTYHRLSVELFLFGFSMIIRNNHGYREKIDFDKLFKALIFLEKCTVNDEVIQIGDNDSGHLFNIKLSGSFKNRYMLKKHNVNYENYELEENDLLFDENYLGTEEIVGIRSLYTGDTSDSILLSLFTELSKEKWLPRVNKSKVECNEFENIKKTSFFSETDWSVLKVTSTINIPISTDETAKINYWEDFGLLIIENKHEDKVFFRTPYDPSDKLLAHIHDDVFSLEYIKNNIRYYRDQGSYNYTPQKKIRNFFRSEKMHFKPVFEIPMVEFTGVFNANNKIDDYFFKADSEKISFGAKWKERVFIREVHLHKENISIIDKSNQKFIYNIPENKIESKGYGKININLGGSYD